MIEIRLSVRTLVEYVLSSGSIDMSHQIKNTALSDGVKTHQRVQSSYTGESQKEVFLSTSIELDGFLFVIEGRCDGLLRDEDGVTIDEIKSSQRGVENLDPENNQVHWAQGKFYGYMYGKQEGLDTINVQLTYADVHTDAMKTSKKTFSINELEDFVYSMLGGYLPFARATKTFDQEKLGSIQQLTFPFKAYRSGQRYMAKAVYKTILDDKKLFVKAPTGIGKTVSTIFPTVKAIGENKINKLIYLTAKTITRTVAEDTFQLLREKGLRMKVCTITAKDKICFKEETRCEKQYCEFADGYYDRINDAVLDIYEQEDTLNRETIEKYARMHTVCPFEFSLDLAMLADGVICDYNYVFDPRVALKRFAVDNKKHYALLVDEAHNLVDRARSMHSASVRKSIFLSITRLFPKKAAGVPEKATGINRFMLELKKKKLAHEVYTTEKEMEEGLSELLKEFAEACEEWLPASRGHEAYEQVLEAYFEVNHYLKIAKLYDEHFITYIERIKSDVSVRLMCLNPAKLLSQGVKHYRGTVFFSATLIPGSYYKEILGGDEDDYAIGLPSPFKREHLYISIANLSTRYKDREKTSSKIIELIKKKYDSGQGNMIVFFPSYQYMELIYGQFMEDFPETNVATQGNTMTESEREAFLEKFQETASHGLLGFAVLGGIFSEGIDLKGSRLGSVIVIGVGLPQFNTEQEIIKDYFIRLGKNGYDYAYVYPGISKVLQAGGRLIRTETDTGQLTLIDDRFLTKKYQQLLPEEWREFEVINV